MVSRTTKTDTTAVASKPAARKPTASKGADKPVKAAEKASKPAAKTTKKSTAGAAPEAKRTPTKVSAEDRRHYIGVAAYFIAERRGFSASRPLDDWLQAEAEIQLLLDADTTH